MYRSCSSRLCRVEHRIRNHRIVAVCACHGHSPWLAHGRICIVDHTVLHVHRRAACRTRRLHRLGATLSGIHVLVCSVCPARAVPLHRLGHGRVEHAGVVVWRRIVHWSWDHGVRLERLCVDRTFRYVRQRCASRCACLAHLLTANLISGAHVRGHLLMEWLLLLLLRCLDRKRCRRFDVAQRHCLLRSWLMHRYSC